MEDLKIENIKGEINDYFSMFKNPNHYHLSKYKDNKPFVITRVSKEKRRKMIEEMKELARITSEETLTEGISNKI